MPVMSVTSREQVLSTLRAHEAEIRAAGVSTLALFGSVRRGTAHADSDVDLLVEFDRPPGLFAFVELRDRLATLLRCRVDLVPKAGLKERLRAEVLREAEVVVAA